MFLKQEKPEMDDLKKENFGSKRKMSNCLTEALAKISQNIFLYSLVSEHSIFIRVHVKNKKHKIERPLSVRIRMQSFLCPP